MDLLGDPIVSNCDRPFARSGHMVRNKLCWDASYTEGLSKQRKVGLEWYKFLCSKSLTVELASQDNLFRTMCPDRAKGLLWDPMEGNSN